MKLKLLKITQSVIDLYGRVKYTMFNGNVNTVSAIQYGPHGDDSRAPKNSIGVYAATEMDGKEATIGVMSTNSKAQIGEKRLFCTDENGAFKFNIWLRADGTVLVGDSEVPAGYTNFAVKYNELKTELDKFKASFNALVEIFNGHSHPYFNVSTPAFTNPTLTPGTQNSSNFATCKADKIKINN